MTATQRLNTTSVIILEFWGSDVWNGSCRLIKCHQGCFPPGASKGELISFPLSEWSISLQPPDATCTCILQLLAPSSIFKDGSVSSWPSCLPLTRSSDYTGLTGRAHNTLPISRSLPSSHQHTFCHLRWHVRRPWGMRMWTFLGTVVLSTTPFEALFFLEVGFTWVCFCSVLPWAPWVMTLHVWQMLSLPNQLCMHFCTTWMQPTLS